MDNISLKLCDIQGRLFELASKQNYDSEKFVSFFMDSDVASDLDATYNRMQWAGEEYLLEEIIANSNGKISISTDNISSDVMYWIGYVYRYWHFLKHEPSNKIYKQATFKTMKRNYMMFHTMDPEVAIENLIEIHKQKKSTNVI